MFGYHAFAGQCKARFTSRKVPYCVRFHPEDEKQHLFVAGTSDKKIVCVSRMKLKMKSILCLCHCLRVCLCMCLSVILSSQHASESSCSKGNKKRFIFDQWFIS